MQGKNRPLSIHTSLIALPDVGWIGLDVFHYFSKQEFSLTTFKAEKEKEMQSVPGLQILKWHNVT